MFACSTCIIIVHFSYNIYENTVEMFENFDQKKIIEEGRKVPVSISVSSVQVLSLT